MHDAIDVVLPEFLHGHYILGKMIFDRQQWSELSRYCGVCRKLIGNLNVDSLFSLLGDKIYFLIVEFANEYAVAATLQFVKDDVFYDSGDVSIFVAG